MITFNNPKNTTIIAEVKIGKQLCKIFGYTVPSERNGAILDDPDVVVDWGHIAGGGSDANLESMW